MLDTIDRITIYDQDRISIPKEAPKQSEPRNADPLEQRFRRMRASSLRRRIAREHRFRLA